MQEQHSLENHIYDLIIELCEVLYHKGYRTVPLGAMMRIIGVDDESASIYDDEIFFLDQDFERILKEKQYQQAEIDDSVPPGVTLH